MKKRYKVNKTRNPVARYNKNRGGYHSLKKYSRKTKYKTEEKV